MASVVNYQKRKNNSLFEKFNTIGSINLSNIQNYIPIYDRFFSLNNTNWNSINLNHRYAICDIKDIKKNEPTENIFSCKLKDINDKNENKITRNVFIKMAPLLDPFKYIVGKYNHNDPNLFNLPSFNKNSNVHPKITDPNNSSFIDGFFSFLTSKVLHEYNFIHGIDYYGSFLAIKTNYKVNIIDDIEYLIQSDFFIKQKGVLFDVEDYSHLIQSIDEEAPLKPINISTSLKSVLSVNTLDDGMFENIFNVNNPLSLEDIKNNDMDLVDITNSDYFDVSQLKKSQTLKSGSTCSSRTSHTGEDEDEDEADNEDDLEKLSFDMDNDNSQKSKNLDDNTIESGSDSSSFVSTIEDETLMLTFLKFPVQVICMEQCNDTLDSLIINEMINEEQLLAALMQIIMILITYQYMFSFTHNDLHTNNVMFVKTEQKYIYYVYKNKVYKVPTFGKIYKIIDFGRAIYKLNNNVFCSDSFKTGGDAATQYNTEPYFNDKKPRLEPNFSFDLCRLACSLYDYVFETDLIASIDTNQNEKSEKSAISKIISDWCLDDNGVNILYKNNGAERYPDFKLYKMIARIVHKHTPQEQLNRDEFSKYLLTNKNSLKNLPSAVTINIDKLPSFT